MYEGPIKAAAADNLAAGEELPILRQLRWTDLVARLAATRDVRAPALAASESPAASFAAFHQISLHEGNRPVNREDSSDRKTQPGIGAKPAQTIDGAANGDRETP